MCMYSIIQLLIRRLDRLKGGPFLTAGLDGSQGWNQRSGTSLAMVAKVFSPLDPFTRVDMACMQA